MNQTEKMRKTLRDFLVREMPAGTVIKDPEWWALRIMDAIDEPKSMVSLPHAKALEFAMSYLQRSGRATREDLEAAHKIRQIMEGPKSE